MLRDGRSNLGGLSWANMALMKVPQGRAMGWYLAVATHPASTMKECPDKHTSPPGKFKVHQQITVHQQERRLTPIEETL